MTEQALIEELTLMEQAIAIEGTVEQLKEEMRRKIRALFPANDEFLIRFEKRFAPKEPRQ